MSLSIQDYELVTRIEKLLHEILKELRKNEVIK